jgi:hypothetical protein
LIGGLTDPALRRAVRQDGWIGVHHKFDDTEALLLKLRDVLKDRDPARAFTIMMNVLRVTADDGARFAEMGVDSVVLPLLSLVRGATLTHQLDAIRYTGERLGMTPAG